MKKIKENPVFIVDEEKLKAWNLLFSGKTIKEIVKELNEIYQKDTAFVFVLVKKEDYLFLKNKSKGKHYVTTQLKVGCIELKKLENLKNPKNS